MPDAAWEMLCRHIWLSPQPFAFLYGPLAEFYAGRIGRRYGVGHVFPTAGTLPEPPEDAFASVQYASLRQKAPVRRYYVLRMHCETGKKEMQRRWGIALFVESAGAWQGQDDLFTSPAAAEEKEQGTAMAELLAESELIREFAGRMGWETFPPTAPPNQRYRYIKEE